MPGPLYTCPVCRDTGVDDNNETCGCTVVVCHYCHEPVSRDTCKCDHYERQVDDIRHGDREP